MVMLILMMLFSIVNDLAVANALRERGRCETRRVLMRCGFHCEKHFSHKILIFRRNFAIIR